MISISHTDCTIEITDERSFSFSGPLGMQVPVSLDDESHLLALAWHAVHGQVNQPAAIARVMLRNELQRRALAGLQKDTA